MEAMDVDTKGFVLREELSAHSGAVRSTCATFGGDLVTGGEDSVVNRWELRAPAEGGSLQATPNFDHDHSVVSLVAMDPGVLDECPTGGFVTGSMDKSIRVFNSEGALVRQLLGHGHGVISLSWDASNQRLLSGSWDGTAKVWDVSAGSCVATLSGHENGVSVLGLPNGCVATGSTGVQRDQQVVDFKIRIWEGERCVTTVSDHLGPVRGLALLPLGLGFASASNDGTVRLRGLDGETFSVLQHSSSQFVYDVVALPGEAGAASAAGVELVSFSEDTCAVVWAGDREVQRIPHPTSVWTGCALPNGDLVTCAHDGVVRVFTRDAARAAPAEAVAAFDASVSEAHARLRSGPSQEEIDKLPDWDSQATTPGRGSGDVKVFRKAGKAIAAQWSAESGTWIEVGEVMGSNSGGVVDGERFDHVLPIEIDMPSGELAKLSLGYNNGQNPYEVAHAFIGRYGLNPDYLEQIATYIQNRVGQAAPMIGSGGAGGQSGTASSATSSTPPPPAAAAASSSAAATKPAPPPFQRFDKPMNLDKILAKIREFQAQVGGAGSPLGPSEDIILSNIGATLSNTSRWHASSFSTEEMRVLEKLIDLPEDLVFPSVDLLRILALHPNGAATLANRPDRVLDGAGLSSPERHFLLRATAPGVPVPVQLVSLRFACNCFVHPGLRSVALGAPERAQRLVDLASSLVSSPTKNVRNSAASLTLNLSYAAASDALPIGVSKILAIGVVAAANAAHAAWHQTAEADDALEACLQAVRQLVEAGQIPDGPAAANLGSTVTQGAENHREAVSDLARWLSTKLGD